MNRTDAESVELYESLRVRFREIGLDFIIRDGKEFVATSDRPGEPETEVLCCANLSTAGGFYKAVKQVQMGTITTDRAGLRVVRPLEINYVAVQ